MTDVNLNIAMKNVKRGTNIKEIVVPPELEFTIPTGIPFVDDAFGGAGITPSMSCLFTGEPGAGKTTLMLQVADAITGAGHVCLFNTNEEAIVQVARTTKRLNVRHGFIVANDRLVPDVIKHAKHLQARNPGRQVFTVCDSLQTHDDGFYSNGHTNSNTPVRVMEQLVDWAKTKNHGQFGIVVCIGMVSKSGMFAGKQALKHIVDSHLHLRIDKDPQSESFNMRLLEMQKNRFGCAGVQYVLRMTKSGLSDRLI